MTLQGIEAIAKVYMHLPKEDSKKRVFINREGKLTLIFLKKIIRIKFFATVLNHVQYALFSSDSIKNDFH